MPTRVRRLQIRRRVAVAAAVAEQPAPRAPHRRAERRYAGAPAASAGHSSGAARDDERVGDCRVVDAVPIRKHLRGPLSSTRSTAPTRRVGGAEGGEGGARACGCTSSRPTQRRIADKPRASPPAREPRARHVLGAEGAEVRPRLRSSSRPPRRRRRTAVVGRQARRGDSAGVPRAARRNFATLYAALGVMARALVQHREIMQQAASAPPRLPWPSPPRASACSTGRVGRLAAANSPRAPTLRPREARPPPSTRWQRAARARRASPRPPRRRSRTLARRSAPGARPPAPADRRRRRSPPRADLLRRLADRRGVGDGVGDAGEERAASSADRRAPSSRSLTRPAAAPSPSPPSKAASAAHAACSRRTTRRAPRRRARARGAAARDAAARRRRPPPGRGRGGAPRRRAPRGASRASSAARSAAPPWWRPGGRRGRRASRSAARAPRGVRRARVPTQPRAARAPRARSGRRRRVASSPLRARARVSRGRRERGGDAAHRGHEGALRLVRAEQPQGDRAGAERDAQLRRRPRARRGGPPAAAARRAVARRARRARLEVAPPAGRVVGAVARCSSYRSTPHTSALCSAHVSCHARLGAPGSDRSWRSAPRARLACSSASAHRPRADAADEQCARSACASRRPRFDVGGGSRSSETRSEVSGSATSDVERRESPPSSRSAASPTRCTSEGGASAAIEARRASSTFRRARPSRAPSARLRDQRRSRRPAPCFPRMELFPIEPGDNRLLHAARHGRAADVAAMLEKERWRRRVNTRG